MSTIQVTDETMAVARAEAARRGIGVSQVVDEAVRRFIGGAGLRRLVEEFRREDIARADALTDDEAQRIVSEELAAVRRAVGVDD